MKHLLNTIVSHHLTPNQLYLLYSIRDKEQPLCLTNVHQEIRMLTPEWLGENAILSEKAIDFLNTMDDTQQIPVVSTGLTKSKVFKLEDYIGGDITEQIEIYRSYFPKKPPNGYPVRNNVNELEKKFTKFFTEYPNYTWETVLSATCKYVSEYAMKDYLYMKTSSYFISKQDVNRTVTYTLATYCDLVLENGDTEEAEVERVVSYGNRLVE